MLAKGMSKGQAAKVLNRHPNTLENWRAQKVKGLNIVSRNWDGEKVVQAQAARLEIIVDDALTVVEMALERMKAGLFEKKTLYSKTGEVIGEEPAINAKDAAFIFDRSANIYMDLTQGRRGQAPINITLHQQKIEAEVANILSQATPEQLAQLALQSPVIEGEVVDEA